ncbi:MAG: flagellar export chaperone FlgN [Gemmatimonadota bacterium]|nr:flagellar export chaperone FlgN [Gemmatimonadota bacterium]
MMQTYHEPQMASESFRVSNAPVSSLAIAALSDALLSERKLIDELTEVVLRQRAAIAVDDLQSVDDSVFATHRLLLTLGEARKGRRTINAMAGCKEETGVKHLADALGPWMTADLRNAREALQVAAARLSREIGINRRILREAIANSDSLVRTVVGAPVDAAQQGYGSTGQSAYKRSDAIAFSRTA